MSNAKDATATSSAASVDAATGAGANDSMAPTKRKKKATKIRYDHLEFRLANWGEEAAIIDFVNEHFDMALPLVNDRTFFEHYYCGERLQFALAEQDGALVAVAGYILANESETPDLWVSVWVAVKGAMGAGLELMDALPRLTSARVVACNNIRENTCAFYRFLGWSAERLPHFYRLSKAASEGDFQLYQPAAVENCNIGVEKTAKSVENQAETVKKKTENVENFVETVEKLADVVENRAAHAENQPTAVENPRLPIACAADATLPLVKVPSAAALAALGLPVHCELQTPAKSLGYLQQRYFNYPYQQYDVWAVQEDEALLALCVTRTVGAYFEADAENAAPCPTADAQTNTPTGTTQSTIPVLRIVDFIGAAEVLPRIGTALDALMEAEGAEYTDCYCAGIAPEIFAAAGFTERREDSKEIVPNYLTSVLARNTEYFYFTNLPEGFTMFKADGDQDRPAAPHS